MDLLSKNIEMLFVSWLETKFR